jgi:cell division transport system ATP-binding protein
MIRFEHVGLRYGVGPEILSDINFTLSPGSFHFLTGSSGAGKTSLLRLLYLGKGPSRGLQTMFGETVNGLNRHELSRFRQKIGVVFQDFRLLEHLSVFDNVALPLRIQKTSESETQQNVATLLEWVGLGDYMHALPYTLSGGQQQRVAVARAVVGKPRLLLADEPTGNLDDEIGMRLLNLFEQLNKQGTTIVIATHDHHLIERFKHPSLVLKEGRLSVVPYDSSDDIEKKASIKSRIAEMF